MSRIEASGVRSSCDTPATKLDLSAARRRSRLSARQAKALAAATSTAMTTRLETLAPDAGLDALFKVLDADHVAIIVEGEKFLGLITRVDLLNALRTRML